MISWIGKKRTASDFERDSLVDCRLVLNKNGKDVDGSTRYTIAIRFYNSGKKFASDVKRMMVGVEKNRIYFDTRSDEGYTVSWNNGNYPYVQILQKNTNRVLDPFIGKDMRIALDKSCGLYYAFPIEEE